MRLFSRYSRASSARPRSFRPMLEQLDERMVLSNFDYPITVGKPLQGTILTHFQVASKNAPSPDEYHAQVYGLGPGIKAKVVKSSQEGIYNVIAEGGTYTGPPGHFKDAEIFVTGPFATGPRPILTKSIAKGETVLPASNGGDYFVVGTPPTTPGTALEGRIDTSVVNSDTSSVGNPLHGNVQGYGQAPTYPQYPAFSGGTAASPTYQANVGLTGFPVPPTSGVYSFIFKVAATTGVTAEGHDPQFTEAVQRKTNPVWSKPPEWVRVDYRIQLDGKGGWTYTYTGGDFLGGSGDPRVAYRNAIENVFQQFGGRRFH